MILCHSRYAYYELVFDQSAQTFIDCHIHAFEYFGGVPKVVRIDNLKAAVLKANFYEATLQIEYAAFLKYYGSSGITCRIRRGQDKGKVESSVKYVKYNFIKGLRTDDYYEAKIELNKWLNETCNCRIHGTTRKIPSVEYQNREKSLLISLPQTRYEIFIMGKRKVSNYGHISFKHNYYSVPHKYKNENVHIKSNNRIIKIFNSKYQEIAVHGVQTLRMYLVFR